MTTSDGRSSELNEMTPDVVALIIEMGEEIEKGFASNAASTRDGGAFLEAAGRDALTAHGAIGLVLSRPVIPSLLVDNLNASIHLRALLTDLFLIDQALKAQG